MKKASKILTLILVFVLLAGVFSSCAMFTRNTGRYRDLEAVTVGSETITVGKVLDSFNNYYNMYSAYIGQGITAEWLLQMSLQSLITQAMKVDSYTSTATPETHAFKDTYHNAQYLNTKEIEYVIRYVKYVTFQSLDSSVQALLSVNRTIGEEEQPDTSRDFTDPDDLGGVSYSEYTYRQRVFNEDAEEYFDKYYGGKEKIQLNSTVGEYVYDNEQAAQAMLSNLKGRLDDDDAEITFSEYQAAQQKVVNQYQRSIQNSYNVTFEQFISSQIEDMIASTIAAKYDWKVNEGIDKTGDALDKTIKQLESNLAIAAQAQETGFNLNNNFVDFIEGLSSSSYIYNVPSKYLRDENNKNGYVFVKNILIPFTAQQTATLANLASDLGGDTTNPAYIKLRNEFAKDIIADDFNSDKGEDGKYATVEDLFDIVKDENGNDKLVIKQDGALGKVFKEGGVIDVNGDNDVNKEPYASADDAVIAYMKRFNTDTAQHTAVYDYVVRVGDVPSGYTAKWVPEFVTAANEAADLGKNHYALAISTYGVHIVYYVDDVQATDFKFMENYNNTTTPEYKLFSAYFSQQSSLLLEQRVDELQKSYLEANKIETKNGFKRFLKDNGFEFDLIKFLTDED